MNKSSMKRGLMALIAGTALLGGLVQAHPVEQGRGCGHMEGNMHHMFRGLDLSDEQQAQIRELRLAHKAERKAQWQARKAEGSGQQLHEQMKALMNAATFDEAAAKRLIAERSARREAGALDAMKLQHQIYQLLTPEQKAKLEARFEQRRQRFEERREARKAARQQPQ